ncbi:glutathione S-transferase C-terminal domain-containing protein-like [Ornithodoros turicata]
MESSPVLMLNVIKNDEDSLTVPLSTFITLFSFLYCEVTDVDIFFVEGSSDELSSYSFPLPGNVLKKLACNLIRGDVNRTLRDCRAPAVFLPKLNTCIGGLAAVIRWAISHQSAKTPGHFSRALLGFRGSTLVACSESSLWTRFCEIDIAKAVHALFRLAESNSDESFVLPEQLCLLEAHMQHPVRTHNIRRKQQDLQQKDGGSKKNSNDLPTLEHQYVEGYEMTIADIILFPCISICISTISRMVGLVDLAENLPLIVKWYDKMLSDQRLSLAFEEFSLGSTVGRSNTMPQSKKVIERVGLPQDNLYSRNPERCKPRIRHKSPQPLINRLHSAGIESELAPNPAKEQLPLPWDSYPQYIHPVGGGLPNKRVSRKCEQIENMVALVVEHAYPGCTIVDFCSGGGHVGVVLAYLLPNCKVIMIENKEESVLRARKRLEVSQLSNVTFFQCNMDYFYGNFDIGVSLHACGVATDLVIQKCMNNNAVFVCCPCCYGSMSSTDNVKYPLSHVFRSSGICYEDYILLCHYADRTEQNTATCQQGVCCMTLIDADRAYWAKEHQYDVLVTQMYPSDCSPKCHILIGKPA